MKDILLYFKEAILILSKEDCTFESSMLSLSYLKEKLTLLESDLVFKIVERLEYEFDDRIGKKIFNT